jgi:hypothetical protein
LLLPALNPRGRGLLEDPNTKADYLRQINAAIVRQRAFDQLPPELRTALNFASASISSQQVLGLLANGYSQDAILMSLRQQYAQPIKRDQVTYAQVRAAIDLWLLRRADPTSLRRQ